MKQSVIIVAGGKGLRMGSDLPKQFLPVGGKPVLMHTLEAFRKYDAMLQIILVLPREQQDFWKQLCEEHHFSVEHLVADGGETRFHSVKNGLTDAGSETVNRTEYKLVQTPQVFEVERLKQAYGQEFTPFFTDDASVVEAMGVPVHLAEGNRENIKITTPFDLKIGSALL